MPRPGPRPYECVRRAWHSDRHQPMRGSLIQEIFRVVNEVHSPSTRRNKEWQEKLPCVVLKAEEIMYSKANSEAEYMDLKTLWDRANDAIDTIIRRDESTESGDLLKPCIEAALNLGCIPRRASRSQRHSNHVCYLSSSTRDAPATPLEIPDNNRPHLGSSISLLPLQPSRPSTQQSTASQFTSWYSASVTPPAMNCYLPEVESVMPDAFHERKDSLPIPNYDFSFPAKNSPYFCQDASLPIAMESCIRPSLGRVYPLYYGNNQPETGSYLSPQKPQEPVHGLAAAATMSHFPPTGKVEIGFLQNYFGRNENVDVPNRTSNLKKMPKNPSIPSCDLSLGLGLPSAPFLVVENAWTHGIEDVASSSSCDGSKSCGLSSTRERAIDRESSLSSPKDKFYDLFPKYSTDEHMESCSSKWSSEGEGTSHLKASDKKRKVCTSAPSNDGYSHWKQNVLTYQLACETGTANS